MNGLKAESYKYSPVQLLPEGFENDLETKTAANKFVVKNAEHTQLVTRYDGTALVGNTSFDIEIGSDASLHHWVLFDEGDTAVHVENTRVQIAKGGRYVLNAVTLGSKWSRSDLHVRLLGEGAECRLIGLDLARGESHVDRHLLIEHLAPRTSSSQMFKGIFDERGSASFFGKIKVHHGADGTSAQQVNRNLLLSGDAIVNTRPQLEIDTDDVSCTHGATVGQLDENAVFFLRSRGLSEAVARSLLTEAFAREVLNAFKSDQNKDDMERRVLTWLHGERQ